MQIYAVVQHISWISANKTNEPVNKEEIHVCARVKESPALGLISAADTKRLFISWRRRVGIESWKLPESSEEINHQHPVTRL